jgi:chemotaxis protein MotB
MAGRNHPAPVRRRKREEEHEEEHGSERWLVTYADMVTLLMVLFIVMFSMSQVDSKKYEQLKEGLASGFGRSAQILSGSSPMLDDEGPTSAGSEVMDNSLVTNMPSKQSQAIKDAVDQAQRQVDRSNYDQAAAQVKSLLGLWQKIHKSLAKKGLADDVQATVDERGLVVSLVSRHVVFQANLANLTERGKAIVDTIAPVLAGIPEPIEVDGHTNQVKVKPKYYPTDWELSAARAVNVLRWLNESDGIPDKRLSATGFGHTKPLMDPKTPGSQKINKRVDIVVLSQAPAETRALFKQVQQDLQNQTGDQP